jgi:WD40 repeat protein
LEAGRDSCRRVESSYNSGVHSLKEKLLLDLRSLLIGIVMLIYAKQRTSLTPYTHRSPHMSTPQQVSALRIAARPLRSTHGLMPRVPQQVMVLQQRLLALAAASLLLLSGVSSDPESAILAPGMPFSGGVWGPDSRQGSSVSLSSDGKVLAVGAPGFNKTSGATWVYWLNGSAWAEMPGMPLSGKGAAGASVSLSSDGKVLAVGAPGYGNNTAVWVYNFTGSAWAEMPDMPLIQEVAVGAWPGVSVSLSSDGTVLAVGAPMYDSHTGGGGGTWLYQYDGSAWAEMPRMPLRGPRASQYGSSVSLSSDGTVLAVGAPAYDGDTGAAWLYRYGGSGWAEMLGMPLGHAERGHSEQGLSVSLSADGTTLAVSGHLDHVAAATWVYQQDDGGTWAEMGGMPLVGPTRSSGAVSVRLSSDGTTLAVGASNYAFTGRTWLYRYSGGAWAIAPGSPLLGPTASEQGASVSLSSDGSVLAVGAPGYNHEGGTWVYATAMQCKPGTYLATGQLPVVCAPAPAGFSAPGYTTSYSACPAGSYSGPGASACEACAAGTFNPEACGAECRPCPPGSFSSTPGVTSCLPCPAGMYSEITQTCTDCPVLQRAAAGSARCTRTGAWYAVVVVVPALALALLALGANHRKLAAAWARYWAWREDERTKRITGNQLEALLLIHGIKNPDALRTIQVREPASKPTTRQALV